MQQYSFRLTAPNGAGYTAHCTAAQADWARLQIVHSYQGFTVGATPAEVHPPHHIYTETDASMMTPADAVWLARQIDGR
jgi:hypothetical protein